MCKDGHCTSHTALIAHADQEYANVSRLVSTHVAEVREHLAEQCCDRMLVWGIAARHILHGIKGADATPDMLAEILACAVLQLAEVAPHDPVG